MVMSGYPQARVLIVRWMPHPWGLLPMRTDAYYISSLKGDGPFSGTLSIKGEGEGLRGPVLVQLYLSMGLGLKLWVLEQR